MAKQKALVVGGAGFVGKHLVRQLLESGRYDVAAFDIRDTGVAGARSIVGDLRKPEEVDAAVKGMDVVFHCAAVTPTGSTDSNRALMFAVNVGGTRYVVDACKRYGVQKLVFTSSSSVAFEGKNLYGVDESAGYAREPMDLYSESKIEAEKIVLGANSPALLTCALRPASLFGEEDPLFVPSLVENARRGKMKYIIGNGQNLTDFTYVGNIAGAHIQAAEALSPTSPVAGEAYFITNAEPRPFWGVVGDVLEGLGYGRPYIKLPYALVYAIALLLAWVVIPLLSPFKRIETTFTPFKVTLASSVRTFSCAKAARDFGYSPDVDMDEALQRTIKYFAPLRNVKGGPVSAKKQQ